MAIPSSNDTIGALMNAPARAAGRGRSGQAISVAGGATVLPEVRRAVKTSCSGVNSGRHTRRSTSWIAHRPISRKGIATEENAMFRRGAKREAIGSEALDSLTRQ